MNSKTEVNMEITASDDLEVGSIEEKKRQEHNVFLDDNDEGPDFRGVSCFGAAVLVAKAQFGLGVLGLPQTFHTLGFVPGLISLIALCGLVTWMGVVMGNFRLNHPQVHSFADAAYLLFGPVGREVMGIIIWLFYTLSFGAAVLTLSIAFDSFSSTKVCAIAWVGVGSAITLILGVIIRTMKVLSRCGYVAVASIFVGVWVVSISCLAQSTPAAAPSGEPVDKQIFAVVTTSSFSDIGAAVGQQLFSLAGIGSFFTIHAEMRDQSKFVKSLIMGQGFVVLNYIANSSVVYGRVGQYVASPALGSAGPLVMQIAYGISMPALIFTSIYQAHISSKYAMVRLLRGTVHLQSNSVIHWITWIGMFTLVVSFGFVVAEAIPFFNDLLGLTGALLGTSFTLILPGFMGFYDLANSEYIEGGTHSPLKWLKESQKIWSNSKRNIFITCISWFTVAAGLYITVSGVYGSIVSILNGYKTGNIGSPFSCEINSV